MSQTDNGPRPKCYICGYEMLPPGPGSLCQSREHVVPRSKGGKDGDNVVFAHRLCNSERGNREVTEELRSTLKARMARAIRCGGLRQPPRGYMGLLKQIVRMVESIDRESSCESKVQYASAWVATRQAYALSESRGEDFEPYRCRYCGTYHVGHAYSMNR